MTRPDKHAARFGDDFWLWSRFDILLHDFRKTHPHAGTSKDPRWGVSLDANGEWVIRRAHP